MELEIHAVGGGSRYQSCTAQQQTAVAVFFQVACHRRKLWCIKTIFFLLTPVWLKDATSKCPQL